MRRFAIGRARTMKIRNFLSVEKCSGLSGSRTPNSTRFGSGSSDRDVERIARDALGRTAAVESAPAAASSPPSAAPCSSCLLERAGEGSRGSASLTVSKRSIVGVRELGRPSSARSSSTRDIGTPARPVGARQSARSASRRSSRRPFGRVGGRPRRFPARAGPSPKLLPSSPSLGVATRLRVSQVCALAGHRQASLEAHVAAHVHARARPARQIAVLPRRPALPQHLSQA